MSFSLRLAVVAMMLLTAAALGLIAFQFASQPARVAAMAPAAPAPVAQTQYIVASHPLVAGTLARDSDFSSRAAPATAVPPGAIVDDPYARAGLRGALIRAYVDAGSPITPDIVLHSNDRGFIANVLDEGSRAVSIGVDAISGVAGLVWPGDRVDVILTQEMQQSPAAQRVLSETILTDARVIAIDQEIAQGMPADSTVAGKLARTVTLQVDRGQAEKLTVAQSLGKLSLAIRSAKDLDQATLPHKPTTFGSDVSPALSRTEAAPPSVVTVNVVEGENRKVVNFQ
jgi:pilus assembly protein CpaB